MLYTLVAPAAAADTGTPPAYHRSSPYGGQLPLAASQGHGAPAAMPPQQVMKHFQLLYAL